MGGGISCPTPTPHKNKIDFCVKGRMPVSEKGIKYDV
jgi:hypothetical protein